MKKLTNYLQFLFKNLIAISIGNKRAKYWLSDEIDRKTLSLREYGYLYETGWTRSIITDKSVDKNNNAVPWLTYPFLSLMEERINKEFNVLEIGSGASTEYFSRKVNEVVSFEDNMEWFEILKKKPWMNVGLHHYTQYSEINSTLETLNKKFDIVLIDSFNVAERSAITLSCLKYIDEKGVLILDDFETKIYDSILTTLEKKEFKKINFWGIAPCITYLKSTTLFYRNGNCFGI